MLDISSFKALSYDFDKVSNVSKLVCPPYDVISPDLQENLYTNSPYNAVRLELPKEENRYEIASERLKKWLLDGILSEQEEAMYPYHQTFTLPNDNKTYVRRGMIVRCRLYEFNRGIVLPHEKTLSKAKADRLSLFKETKANLSPIFGIYNDSEKQADELASEAIKSLKPFVEIYSDYQGVKNVIWKVTDKAILQHINQSFKDKKIYIADGHHRYETAINYRNYRNEMQGKVDENASYNYIMMYIANVRDEGMVVLPTHRLVHSLPNFDREVFLSNLSEYFEIREVESKEAMQRTIADGGKFMYGVVFKDKMFTAKLKTSVDSILGQEISSSLKKINVTLLHKAILEDQLGISEQDQMKQTNLVYAKALEGALESVRTEKVQMAFILNPIGIDEMIEVCESGELMPQKSTFFFPKILSGITFYSLA